VDKKHHKTHYSEAEDAEVDNTLKKNWLREIKIEETLDLDEFDDLDAALVHEVNFLLKR